MSQSAEIGIVGQEAPELNLDTWIDPDGNPVAPVRLAEMRGTVIFLLFWQSWCSGCHQVGFPTLQRLSNHFKNDERIAFFAVQTVFEGFEANTRDKVRETQRQYRLKIPMAHDAGKATADEPSSLVAEYRSGGTPWIVIIDKQGVVRFNGFRVNEDRIVRFLEPLITERVG